MLSLSRTPRFSDRETSTGRPSPSPREAGNGDSAFRLSEEKKPRYPAVHLAYNCRQARATFRQRSIGRSAGTVLAYHVGNLAFSTAQSGYGEHRSAIVITAAEDDLLPVGRPVSAAHEPASGVSKPQAAFRPPTNWTYRSPLTGFSPSQKYAICLPSGENTGFQ